MNLGDHNDDALHEVIWVRHGQSTWNRRGVMQGQSPGPSLTLRGHRQAHRAAQEIAKLHPMHLYSSDLRRATQTARYLARALHLPVRITPLLRERGWGSYEGCPSEAAQRVGDVLGWCEPIPGGGESMVNVADRLDHLVSGIADGFDLDGPIVFVTHGDVIREAQRLWGDPSLQDAVDNGGHVKLLVDHRVEFRGQDDH